nr:ribonuclease Y [Candidatus Gracilibacteria bacterium]
MTYIIGFAGAIFGIALASVVFFVVENKRLQKSSSKSEIILKDAEKKKEEILANAIQEKDQILKLAREESYDMTKKAEKIEERILEREVKIETKLDEISKKQEDLLKQEDSLKESKKVLNSKIDELDGKLSEIAKLSEKEARELFLSQIGEKYENDALGLIDKHKKKVEERKKEIAKEIVIKSIQQYAGDVTSESTATIIEIPSDDIKGKLIGKEGRNITSFERATGVALIIDDTPNSVFLSAFDLYRRYVAKKSLEKLIEDGRIQPARIEEVVQKTEEEADILLKELGNTTLDELGINGSVPDEIIPLIGKLRFRTSYGQNILKHSKEVAMIAASIAKDLGVDQKIVKIGGLLHDIGKALDHDIEGTHPEIGAKVGRKYGLQEKIVDMIENHHGEPSIISLEAAIVQVADAISSVRPGARREAVEEYIKRVQEMENLAASFSGVNKAYAISAGREVRVFVDANTISDLEAQELARDIAQNIQENLSYPGEVKVNLIREMRVIEYAK